MHEKSDFITKKLKTSLLETFFFKYFDKIIKLNKNSVF